MKPAMKKAIETVAKHFEWDQMDLNDLGLLLYALFHYYGQRVEQGFDE